MKAYIIVRGINIIHLEKKVNEKIDVGYYPLGGATESFIGYIQTMVYKE